MNINNIKQNIQAFWASYKELIVILLLALLVRGIFFLAILGNFGESGFMMPENEDSQEYVNIARNIADHGVFSRDAEAPFGAERLRTPGYPLFLSFFYRIYPSVVFLALVQNIFFLAAVALIYKIALICGSGRKIALIAAGLLAFEPLSLYWNNQLTTESVFTVFLLSATYCFLLFFKLPRIRLLLYSGFFLGFSLLIRPVTQYLVIIFFFGLAVFAVAQKLSLKKYALGAVIFLSGYMVIVSPWMARNYFLFGTTSVSTMNVGFGKYVRAIHNELGIYVDYTRYGGVPRSEVERLEIVRQDAIRTIIAHPFIFAKIHLSGLLPFFLGDGYVTALSVFYPALLEKHVITDWSGSPAGLIKFFSGHRGLEAVIFWSGKVIWGSLFLLMLYGAIKLCRTKGMGRSTAIFLLIIIYYFALASGVGSYSRFRFPINPFIFYFAASGIMLIFLKIKSLRAAKRGLTQ